jgi:hypothetical protein
MLRLMTIVTALLFSPISFPNQESVPSSPPPTATAYIDRDAYEVYTVLLKEHHKQFYVVQAETKFKAGRPLIL